MIARFATTRRYLGEEGVGREGKMTTASGAQEWLRRAARGEMETPMLERWGEVREKELEVNCERRRQSSCGCGGGEGRTREQRSSRAVAEDMVLAMMVEPT